MGAVARLAAACEAVLEDAGIASPVRSAAPQGAAAAVATSLTQPEATDEWGDIIEPLVEAATASPALDTPILAQPQPLVGNLPALFTVVSEAPTTRLRDVFYRAAMVELPGDCTTLGAALAVVVLTFLSLQLMSWRPRTGWVWLPGGGGGAAIGLCILAIAPRAFLPSSLLFLCAVSTSELFTLSEQSSGDHAIDPNCAPLLRGVTRWLPARLFATLASVIWLLAVLRVLLFQAPQRANNWSGSKPLYAAELQLLLAAW